MTASIAQAYEELPYPENLQAQMHPDRLATIAALFGLETPPVNRCRVLEIGCGEGASLISFAFGLPQAAFLGMDVTPAAIAAGRAQAGALGLKNIEFRCMDLLEAGGGLGTFDYILCHGLYSWVPAPVRDKLLEICQALLAPNGAAYISYNTRPAGDLRMMLREMMLYHIPDGAPAAVCAGQGRALAKFLAEAKAGNENYQRLMQWQQERVSKLPDALLFHDDLSETHYPVFFHEFMQHATQHSLQYLGEADFYEMSEQRFSPQVRETLASLGDKLLVREQYMDFLVGRAFRQTLLCHATRGLDRVIRLERLRGLHFASPSEPISAHPEIAGSAAEEFRAAENVTMKTAHPLAKAIFVTLGEAWPRSLTFEEIRLRAAQHLGEVTMAALAEGLLEIYSSGPFLHFHGHPPQCAALSDRPKLSPLARLQAEAGRPRVTSLRHFSVDVSEPLFRKVLLLLDGTRDRAALIEGLAAAVESGEIAAPPTSVPNDALQLRAQIAEGLDRNLRSVARMALLIA